MPLNLDQQLTRVRNDHHNTLLSRSFDIVRQACGWKVGVAAHTHGLHIQDYVEIFGLREVRLGQTATLALGPKLVLGHASTSLFCRPRQDPVVLLTCGEQHASFMEHTFLRFNVS